MRPNIVFIQELARITGWSVNTVSVYSYNGKFLPAAGKEGGSRFWWRVDVDKWMEENR